MISHSIINDILIAETSNIKQVCHYKKFTITKKSIESATNKFKTAHIPFLSATRVLNVWYTCLSYRTYEGF